MLKDQSMWQTNTNGLVLLSELAHPYSEHNNLTGAVDEKEVPSSVMKAQESFSFVKRGFYAKNALEPEGTYVPKVIDTRLKSPSLYSRPNHAIRKTDPKLMDEILRNQRLRAEKRGLV
jgi:hypothetical protein